ncbi:MAG: tetratricopeptide repeat protein [Thermoguttaceae bacterium]
MKAAIEKFLSKPWRQSVAGAFVLLVVVFVVYWPSLFGGFLLDDDNLIWGNNIIRQSDGLLSIWKSLDVLDYWPVSNSSLWLEWRLWQEHTTGYHLTNDLLHVAACALLWLILRRLSIPGAFLAALLFAVHPVNVESIAWIAQRKDALAIVFFLLSVLCFVEAELRGVATPFQPPPAMPAKKKKKQPAEPTPPLWRRCWRGSRRAVARLKLAYYPPGTLRWCLLSLLTFILAVLSKGSATILPLVLALVVLWRRRPTKADAVRLLPFFAVAAVLAQVNIWFQNHGGPPIRRVDWDYRLLQAGAVTWFYLSKAVLPFDLMFVYPMWNIDPEKLRWWIPAVAAGLFTVALLVWAWRKPRFGRPVAFAWLFFLAALFPMMGFADISYMQFSLVADHYQHIALLAVVTLAAAGAWVWHDRARGSLRAVPVVVSLGVVLLFSFLSFQQNRLYKDEDTLYHATIAKYRGAIAKNPACRVLHNELGRKHTRRAIELAREGRSSEAIGELSEAKEWFQRAIALKADYAMAYNNLASALGYLGRRDEAIRCYHKALELGSGYRDARLNLGNTLMGLGRLPEAYALYAAMLARNPRDLEARVRCSQLMLQDGLPDKAIALLKEIRTNGSDSALSENQIGYSLFNANRIPDAIDFFQHAISLDPDLAAAHFNLATSYRKQERNEEAAKEFKEAIRCDSANIAARREVAELQMLAGRGAEGLATAQKAADIARSKGDEKTAAEIELWIKSCQPAK